MRTKGLATSSSSSADLLISSSSEKDLSQITEKKVKKLLKRNFAYIKLDQGNKKIPKTISSDIRAIYFSMFINIINSFDLLLLKKFLNQYCRNDCTLNHFKPGEMVAVPGTFELFSSKMIFDFFRGQLAVVPDGYIKFDESKVSIKNDWNGSQVSINLNIIGTQLYKLPVQKWLPSFIEHLSQKREEGAKINVMQKPDLNPNIVILNNETTTVKRFKTSSITELKEFDRELFCSDYISLPKPIPISISGKLILHLDHNKNIKRFVLEGQAVDVGDFSTMPPI